MHPEILNTYLDGSLLLEIKQEVDAELRESLVGLKPEEAAVLGLLRTRLSEEIAAAAGSAPSTQALEAA